MQVNTSTSQFFGMQTYHTITFEHTIWKLLLDYDSDILAVELRNSKQKQVHFLTCSFREDNPICLQLAHPQTWWAGLEACHHGVVIIHAYADHELPVHQGLHAYDMQTGRHLWSNSEWVFSHFTERGICCTHPIEKASVILHLRTGLPVDDKQGSSELPNQNQEAEIRFPEIFSIDAVKIKPFTQTFSTQISLDAIEEAALLTLGEKAAAYFYTQNQNTLAHHLCIFEHGKLSFHHVSSSKSQKPIPDTFFVYRHYLFWIEEECSLHWLEINTT